MTKILKISFASLWMLFALVAQGQEHSHAGATAIEYPNIPGYLSLKTDFHIHSVFSDGTVWPSIRVQEALRENLDAISLTEHLEYQPHKSDIPHPDRNRAHEIALKEAADHGLLIIRGSEITRALPVGHNNAIFIQDANTILQEKAEDAFKEAKKQGAFVFWNHPAWYVQQPNGTPALSDFQKERIANDELHGIEVINTGDYSEEALQIALDNGLTIMGTSDVHDLIDWDYTEKAQHRPITLVFAKEKTTASLLDALKNGRTVAVFNDLLVGKSEFLTPLIQASVTASEIKYIDKTQVLSVTLHNHSSSDLLFENQMPHSLYRHSPVFTIPAGDSLTLQIKT
ncbi:MAG: Sb-PDE family phosphodiesterase, partial [Flavobacteriaceae bacterium]